jgi:hypothetical protein
VSGQRNFSRINSVGSNCSQQRAKLIKQIKTGKRSGAGSQSLSVVERAGERLEARLARRSGALEAELEQAITSRSGSKLDQPTRRERSWRRDRLEAGLAVNSRAIEAAGRSRRLGAPLASGWVGPRRPAAWRCEREAPVGAQARCGRERGWRASDALPQTCSAPGRPRAALVNFFCLFSVARSESAAAPRRGGELLGDRSGAIRPRSGAIRSQQLSRTLRNRSARQLLQHSNTSNDGLSNDESPEHDPI